MRKSVIPIVIALLVGAWVLAVTACGGPDAGDISSSGWITFHSERVSLQLPDSFKGGDPRDPAALSELEALAARNPDPEMAEMARSRVEDMRSSVHDGPGYDLPELEMWSEPDAEGRMARVFIAEGTPRDGWSLQDYLDDSLSRGAGIGITLEFQTEDRAYFIISDGQSIPGEMMLVHEVIVMAGEMPYYVHYFLDEASNTGLEEIFRASARTIEVVPSVFYHDSTIEI